MCLNWFSYTYANTQYLITMRLPSWHTMYLKYFGLTLFKLRHLIKKSFEDIMSNVKFKGQVTIQK